MDPILEIAKRHRLFVIEDACQAHGAAYKGRPAGSLGDAGCFSFYPSKNLGAFGEAGGVTTDNEDLARKVEMLREHGQSRKHVHTMIGWNGRMDGIQAAVLQIKLRHLKAANLRRREHAAAYQTLLQDVDGVVLPAESPHAIHVYHIYALRVPGRDELMEKMTASGIGCGIHYPVPVHLQEAYRHLAHKVGDFPIAERAASEFLSIPLYPELTTEQIEAVVAAVKNAVGASAVV
jgi:dTDP-4-amino-4,6-dideoxygalactose transaminase